MTQERWSNLILLSIELKLCDNPDSNYSVFIEMKARRRNVWKKFRTRGALCKSLFHFSPKHRRTVKWATQ